MLEPKQKINREIIYNVTNCVNLDAIKHHNSRNCKVKKYCESGIYEKILIPLARSRNILYKLILISIVFLTNAQATEYSIIFDKKAKNSPVRAGPERLSLNSPEKTLFAKPNRKSNIKSLQIKRGNQSALSLNLTFSDGERIAVPTLQTDDDKCFDNDGILKDDCVIDLAFHDFNEDMSPEIIISISDLLTEQTVYIFKYHDPINPNSRKRLENWDQYVLKGQGSCHISKEFISFKVGSRGFTDTFFFKSGLFYKER